MGRRMLVESGIRPPTFRVLQLGTPRVPHRTFIAFILPSIVAMLLFIATPIVSFTIQSLYVEHDKILVTSETCQPLGGCVTETRVDSDATAKLRQEQPLGKFNGLGVYKDHNHLAFADIRKILAADSGFVETVSLIYDLPFYRALVFTLTYALTVTPLAMCLGFIIALAVNAVPKLLKGPVIFFSLLPMVVTPLIGSLVVYWMINAEGILGAAIQHITGNPDLSLKASPLMTWITLICYGIWTNAPFSFIVFYSGLQTVPSDTMESAMIDGASRLQRVRFVVLPTLMPLAVFVALVQLMDNFRVLEPIIGFNAAANATSLSYSIFTALNNQSAQMFSSAAATSVLTIAGVVILLTPVLVRTARQFGMRT
jgi:ABC-type sugar transport system permease subunit